MDESGHWNAVYQGREPDGLSWYQAHARRSLGLIDASGTASDAPLIDVGGGTSPLAADLLARGFRELWLLDLSTAALDLSRTSLGEDAVRVHFVAGDACSVALPSAYFAVWHDRAVFHFLTDPGKRAAYVEQAWDAVAPGGHLIIATFAEDGPRRCSGLPVMRYSAEELAAQFASGFDLLGSEREMHRTPAGEVQSFVYCLLRRAGAKARGGGAMG
ncbi:MAG: class I SAM-dependent methyltransferase [Gammaproteobacteria bacterium]|nr:class I SAM-dependent methyltransferase [Gammaproteobacteria bacterium]